MLKVKIDYPSKEEELLIMRANVNDTMPAVRGSVSAADILRARSVIHEIYMDEKIERYILDIVFATRNPKQYNLGNLAQLISYGASPRASIALAIGAKAYAFIKRRGYVVPEDIRAISHDVLRHRIAVTYEAEAEEVTAEQVVQEVLNKIEVP
jgi:MoxR-like ATPase